MGWVKAGNMRPTVAKYKHYRPQLTAIGPGVGSFIEGKYWFDGVEMHLELGIQMAGAGAGFVGTAPSFKTPTTMEVTLPSPFLMMLGVGHAHNAYTGAIHPVAARMNTSTDVGFWYWNGTTYAAVTSTTPLASGILNGFYIKISYIPASNVAPNNFVAFGDSITRFEAGAGYVGDINWTPHVPVQDSLVFGGGFAQDSATSAIVLAGAKKMNADVAVCLVGVNDIYAAVPQATTIANIVALEAKVGADKFVLCKLAPYNANPAAAVSLSAAYEVLAAERGWTLIDPYAAYRKPDGTWTAGASGDGVHPTVAVQQAAALVYRAGIVAALA